MNAEPGGFPAVREGLRTALFGLGLACVTACGQTVAEDEATAPELREGDSAARLHVVQIIEKLDAGINKRREGYRHALDLCRRAGLSTIALSEEQESLIGTERWQVWNVPGHLAWRRDAWDVVDGGTGPGQMCRFHLKHTGTHEHLDGQRVLMLDLESGVLAESPADPAQLSVAAIDPPDAQALAESRAVGYSGPVATSVAGQPCDQWTSDSGASVCIWTGGHHWGYASAMGGEFSSLAGIDTHRIILQADPAPDQIGDRLRTTRFDVGDDVILDGMLPQAGAP